MAQEIGFVRLPPDSTGKKSAAAARLVIDFTGESSPNLFEVGDTVTGGTSGATGTVIGINRRGFTLGDGQLYLDVSTITGAFSASEALQISAITYATITASASLDELYYQKDIIVDKNNPHRSLNIDALGAASITFADGQPALSPFGALLSEGSDSVRQYVYAYDELPNQFWDVKTGGAGIVYNSGERSITLDTNGTASGVLSQRTSHFYHQYQPGAGFLILHSITVGDTGKTNVRRRWGLFDDEDGVYWELDGTTLYAVIRSSTTGSVVENKIAQADFDKDPLDGTNGFTLDVSKANLYWIDLQWLGVGVVRFGVYEDDGTKTTAHVFKNPNTNTSPYMKRATLPIRLECENTNTAGSSSELKHVCTSIQNLGSIKRQLSSFATHTDRFVTIDNASGEINILSTRAAITYKNQPNKIVSLVKDVSVYNAGNAPVLIRVRRGHFASGAVWNSSNIESSVEVDTTATPDNIVQGREIWAGLVGPNNTKDFDFLNQGKQYQDDVGMLVFADNVTSPPITLTAETIGPGSGNILATIGWKEVLL